MEPSEAFAPLWKAMQEKIHMSKIVIEFLKNNEAAEYEDLLNQLEVGHLLVLDFELLIL